MVDSSTHLIASEHLTAAVPVIVHDLGNAVHERFLWTVAITVVVYGRATRAFSLWHVTATTGLGLAFQNLIEQPDKHATGRSNGNSKASIGQDQQNAVWIVEQQFEIMVTDISTGGNGITLCLEHRHCCRFVILCH